MCGKKYQNKNIYRTAIQKVANLYSKGLFVNKYEASFSLRKSLEKMKTYELVNDEIITLLAIFAIAHVAHEGSVEYLYNTICKHQLIVVDNIHVAFKYKYDPSTIVDSLRLLLLYNCFLSKTKINEHIMRKNAYIERMRLLSLENNIRRLFVKDDERKLQNFVNICEKLYNRDYDTI